MTIKSADTEEQLKARFALLDARLSIGRVILLQRGRRMILERAVRDAADIALPLAMLGAAAILCHVTGWISRRPAWVLFACCLLVWMVFLIRGLWACWTVHVSMMDAAERIDLAGGTQNRLATAMEFRTQQLADGLSALAIDDAIQHAQSSDALEPILPTNPPSARFKYELIGFLICLLILGLALRFAAGGNGSSHPAMTVIERNAMPHPGKVDSLPRESHVRADDMLSNQAHPTKPLADRTIPLADSRSNAGGASAQSLSSNSAAAAASAQGNAGAQGAAAGQSIASASAQADYPIAPPTPQLAEDGSDLSRSDSHGKGAAVASGSPSDTKNPPAADNQPESQSQGDHKQRGSSSKQQNQNGGNSSGQKGETKSTGMNAQGAENTESTGGGGSGSGQSGSKKSRGVGMGLLGIRTPDLFKGQELPGPEQQSALPAAPNPSNQIPASSSVTPQRQGDETSIDSTHIDSAEADVVNAYFLQLHQNK